MDNTQFLECIPRLGVEFAKAKSRELRFKLQELKAVLLYPATTSTTTNSLPAKIKAILDEIDPNDDVHKDQQDARGR